MRRYPDLIPSSEAPPRNYANQAMRERLEQDIARYLSSGGKIHQVTCEDNKGWNFDPHRPAVVMRNQLKQATWEAQVRRDKAKMA